jgi:hypothetical protein
MDGRPRIKWLTIFLDFPAGDFDDGVAFWREVTGSGLSPRRGQSGQFATLIPPGGDPWLRVQRVASGPGGCHLDLHVDMSTGTLDEAAGHAIARGASVRHREDGLIIGMSPGGFVFCLVRWEGEAEPPGPVSAGAATCLADQLCLDVPPEHDFDRERQFWAALLDVVPPEHGVGGRAEFSWVGGRAGAVRLLMQRRALAGAGEQVSGHVDAGCAELAATTGLHVAAGARVIAQDAWWTVLADPAGRQYCLVERPAELP